MNFKSFIISDASWVQNTKGKGVDNVALDFIIKGYVILFKLMDFIGKTTFYFSEKSRKSMLIFKSFPS